MELMDAKGYLEVIKAAEQRRIELLPDHQSVAYEHRIFNDEPFINELCIVFLVALRHHIEGRLIVLAARAADHGKPITKSEFEARMNELKERKSARNGS